MKLKLYKLLTNFINIPPTYFENNQLRNYIFPHLNNKQDLVNENVDSSKKRKKSFKNPLKKSRKRVMKYHYRMMKYHQLKLVAKKKLVDIILQQKNL